ncbi:hypothetical protein Bbelb_006060 [Branchiostoma belcheri]|nr:hypothetical protein Bbelb_006060 [Branchiostoma belcheri]
MAGDLIAHEVNPRHPGTTYIGGETVVCETSLVRHIVRGTVRFLFSVTDDREGRVHRHRLWQCVTRVQSVPQQFSLYNVSIKNMCNKTIDATDSQYITWDASAEGVATSYIYGYDDNVYCTLTLRYPGRQFYVQYIQVDMEKPSSSGKDCPDYVRLYDGNSTSATPLSSAVCDSAKADESVISRTNAVTIEFSSDNRTTTTWASSSYTPHSTGPPTSTVSSLSSLITRQPPQQETCSGSDFQCDSGDCISKGLVCDFQVHCADRSDESSKKGSSSNCIALGVFEDFVKTFLNLGLAAVIGIIVAVAF